MNRYHFMSELKEAKEAVAAMAAADPAEGLHARVAPENVSLQGTSTLALFLALYALREKGAKRVLLVTPTYFSIADSCEVLGLELALMPTRVLEGNIAEPGAVLEAVRASKADVVVVTNPTYPSGVRWSAQALERIVEGAWERGCVTLLDMSQGGLPWDDDPLKGLRALRIESLESLVVVQSPSKALLLHGCRFAHAIASPDVAGDMDDYAYVVGGAVTSFQAELATMVYERAAHEARHGAGDLARARREIVSRLKQARDDLQGLLRRSGAPMCEVDSGILTMLALPSRGMSLKEEQRFTEELLWRRGTHALPGSCFRVSEEANPLCYRLNLARPRPELLAGVEAVLETDASLR